MADVFLNLANFASHTFLTLEPPSSFALNLKALIKVSKVSWTSQVSYEILRSSLERKFEETNFISPKRTPPKSPHRLGLKENWSIFIFWVFIPVSYTVSFYGYRIRASKKLGLEVGWLTFLSLSQKGGPTSNPNCLNYWVLFLLHSNPISWVVECEKKPSKSRIIEGIFPNSPGIAKTTQTVRLMFSNVAYRTTVYKTGIFMT